MNDVEQFVQLCHAESEQVGRLLAVLEDEQQLLIQGQVNRLESVADTKSRSWMTLPVRPSIVPS
ncbi:flagellar protein FlgN [Paludibacterium denitrificans]|uniref:Uncharacterized protein n=1 Tax=Paludibacterium denitrificans TaxID=2675226 RepID=A0A844GDG6_9NEIS|nr:flagellar protein FlgN [Paludibacterium denitrificans]MTD32794.1 hypothetical protein [Paludibacterium denitrificans]